MDADYQTEAEKEKTRQQQAQRPAQASSSTRPRASGLNQLHQTIGNRAVGRLLQAEAVEGQHNDAQQEQEATPVAQQPLPPAISPFSPYASFFAPLSLQEIIQRGWRAIARLDKAALQGATVGERMEMLKQLIQAYWTGGLEEEAIIHIIETTPESQAATLVGRLTVESVGGRIYLAALDEVVDHSNSYLLHVALSQLRLRGTEPKKRAQALESAPVLPWYDRITKDVTFKVDRSKTGPVCVQYHSSVFNEHVAIGRYTSFTDELRSLPSDILTTGHTYDPNQLLVIHDYETGKLVPVVAQELVGLEHQYIRSFLLRAGVTTAIAAAPFVAEAVPAVAWVFSGSQLASGLSSIATNLLGQAWEYGAQWDRYNLQSLPFDYALAVAGNQLASHMFEKIPAALPLKKLDPEGQKIFFWFARNKELWKTWAKNFGKQQAVFLVLTNFVALLRAWTADIEMKKNLTSANISNATSAIKSVAEQTFLSTDIGNKWFPGGRKNVGWIILNRMIDQIWKTAIQIVTGAVAGSGQEAAKAHASAPSSRSTL